MFYYSLKNLNKIIYFYCELLGMKFEEFKSYSNSNVSKCLKFGNQKINLHEYDNLIKTKAKLAKPGMGDICLSSFCWYVYACSSAAT